MTTDYLIRKHQMVYPKVNINDLVEGETYSLYSFMKSTVKFVSKRMDEVMGLTITLIPLDLDARTKNAIHLNDDELTFTVPMCQEEDFLYCIKNGKIQDKTI